MESVVAVAACVICLAASVWDLRTRRIPNLLTGGAMLAGLATHAYVGGLGGVVSSGAGLVVGLVLFFPFFALGGLGAGDVKLLGALGAWLGVQGVVWTALHACIAGGVLALLVVALSGRLGTTLANLWVMLLHWRTAGPSPVPGLTLADATGPRLAYAVPISLGTMVTLWLR